jgi:hypothetical protein
MRTLGETAMRSIPTHFCVTKYRSRLETKWARFFRTLSIAIEYEPGLYRLSRGSYLPDFWLPRMQIFIEIKPRGGSEEPSRYKQLALISQYPVLCIKGDPLPGNYLVRLYTPERRAHLYPTLLAALFAEHRASDRCLWLSQGPSFVKATKIWSKSQYEYGEPVIHSPWIMHAFGAAKD